MKVLYKRRRDLHSEYLSRNGSNYEAVSSSNLGNSDDHIMDTTNVSFGERLKYGKINVIRNTSNSFTSSVNGYTSSHNIILNTNDNNSSNKRKKSIKNGNVNGKNTSVNNKINLYCVESDDGMKVTIKGISQSLIKKIIRRGTSTSSFENFEPFSLQECDHSPFLFRKRKEVKYYSDEDDGDDAHGGVINDLSDTDDGDFEL